MLNLNVTNFGACNMKRAREPLEKSIFLDPLGHFSKGSRFMTQSSPNLVWRVVPQFHSVLMQLYSLSGDVGGFMGLLLGGSVITLFEFFDLVLFKLCFCKHQKKRSLPESPQTKRRSSEQELRSLQSVENGPQSAI